MKYYLIETDPGNYIPYAINVNRAIDTRYANKENAHKIPDCCVVDMKTPMEVFFPDILISPFLMVSDTVAEVISMYSPETMYKSIYLLESETGLYADYYMAFIEELDCLSDKTRTSRGGTELLEIVLRKEVVSSKAVFRISGYEHTYLIGRMDFMESIIRRDVEGFQIKEIEVV